MAGLFTPATALQKSKLAKSLSTPTVFADLIRQLQIAHFLTIPSANYAKILTMIHWPFVCTVQERDCDRTACDNYETSLHPFLKYCTVVTVFQAESKSVAR